MRIHLVEKHHSYAMRRYADPLHKYCPPDWIVSESEQPDATANVNIYIPWHLLEGRTGSDIVLFTHLNPTQDAFLTDTLKRADHVMVMSTDGERIVRKHGWDKPLTTAVVGVDGFIPRKLNIGVIGREYPNGRKRMWLPLELAWSNNNMAPFHFTFVGENLEFFASSLAHLGVSVSHATELSEEGLRQFYHSIDILLCTGFTEGGPLSLLEAMASGVIVVAPPTGFALEYLPPEHIYHSPTELYQILREISQPIRDRVFKVESLTDARYAEIVFNLCLEFAKRTRYEHVTNIVRSVNAKTLMEIGVAHGTRALEMIKAASETPGTPRYYGYDLFRPLTHEELTREFSKQPLTLQEIYDLLKPTGAEINLRQGSTDKTLYEMHTFLDEPKDFIFVDGGHSWETIENDWKGIQPLIHNKTVVLFDDYYPDNPDGIGCQKLVDSLDRKAWDVEVLEPIETWNGLKMQMASVRRNGY